MVVHPNLAGYSIGFSREASKSLRKMEKDTAQKIIKKIKQLVSDTASLNIKKIKHSKHTLYRLRVDNYRIIYSIVHEKIRVEIVSIGHRREIYKKFMQKFLF